jgi:MFS family permease
VTAEPNIGGAAASAPPDGQQAWRGASKWYFLGILAMINLLGAADRGVISVVTEPLKAEYHLSDKQIGLLSGLAYSVTFALAVLPMGWLVDRVNRRALLSVTVTIWSVLTAVCAVSVSFAMMFVARMGVGVGEAPVTPASLSLIADLFPVRQRNTAVSLFLAGAGIGVLLQFLVGAWLVAHFNWRTVFLVAGGPGMLLAVLLYFTTREPVRGAFDAGRSEGHAAAQKAPRTIDALRSIICNSALCFAIPAVTITTGVSYSLVTWTTSFLVRVHGMSVSEGATSMGLGFGLCMTVGSLLAGPAADFFSKGDPRTLALVPAAATFIAAVAGTVMTMANSLPVALAALGVLGFMGGFYLGPGYAIILALAAPNERGTTMATAKLIATFLGSSAITFMTGAISDAVGGADSIRPALLGNAAMLLLSTFCFAMIHRILDLRNKAIGSLAAA